MEFCGLRHETLVCIWYILIALRIIIDTRDQHWDELKALSLLFFFTRALLDNLQNSSSSQATPAAASTRSPIIAASIATPLATQQRKVQVVAFSSLERILGECSIIRSPSALFSSSFFFFLKWRLALVHYFHSLCQDQSTVAQRDEMTVAKCTPPSCVSSFLR